MLNYRAKPKLKRPSEKLERKISKNIINSKFYTTSDKFHYVNFWDLGLKLNPKIDVFVHFLSGLQFRVMAMGIIADDEVNFKEAYALLYWLEDHVDIANQYQSLYLTTKEALDDDHLDHIEAAEIKVLLKQALMEI